MIKRIAPFVFFLAVAACVVVCPGTEPATCLTYEKSVTCNTCQSPEEFETIHVFLGAAGARMDVGDTSFVLRDERFQVWIHHRRQYWDLAYPVVLDSVVRAEQLAELEQARESASSEVEVEAVRVGEVESENRMGQPVTSWRFLVRQGNLGRNQEIELRTRRLEADREESFWRLVDAIADLSILESDWIRQLPAIEGIPARLVVERAWGFPFGLNEGDRVDLELSRCEVPCQRSVSYDVPAGYEEVQFDLSAIVQYSDVSP